MPTHPFLSIRTRKANCPTCCLPLLSYCYSGIHHCQLSVISFITLRLSSSFHIYLNISRALLYSSLRLVPSVTWSSLRGSTDSFSGSFPALLVLRRAGWAQKQREASAVMPASEIHPGVHFKTKKTTNFSKISNSQHLQFSSTISSA